MSTLERRLQDALRERAAQVPIGPDAWPRTIARAWRPLSPRQRP